MVSPKDATTTSSSITGRLTDSSSFFRGEKRLELWFRRKSCKAPRFDTVPEDEFDKGEYSLYKLPMHIDQLGFIWVNLDASEKPAVGWEEQFKEVDTQERLLKNYNMNE